MGDEGAKKRLGNRGLPQECSSTYSVVTDMPRQADAISLLLSARMVQNLFDRNVILASVRFKSVISYCKDSKF